MLKLTGRLLSMQGPVSYASAYATAVKAVRQGALLCQSVSDRKGGIDSVSKTDASPVTIADFGTQALVCRAIRDKFDGDLIMGEEDSSALRGEGAAQLAEVVSEVQRIRPDMDSTAVCEAIDAGNCSEYNPRMWALDPIDGTKGYLRGDQYAIALALLEEGRPVVSVVGCPNLTLKRVSVANPGFSPPTGLADPASPEVLEKAQEVFNGSGLLVTAVRGFGCWVRSLHPEGWENFNDPSAEGTDGGLLRVGLLLPDPAVRVVTGGAPNLQDSVMAESFENSHSNHKVMEQLTKKLGIQRNPLRIDSQCKYAAVAMGWADAYVRIPAEQSKLRKECLWDHAAGALLVEEAQGIVTDMDGKPLAMDAGSRLEGNRGIIAASPAFHAALASGIAEIAAPSSKL